MLNISMLPTNGENIREVNVKQEMLRFCKLSKSRLKRNVTPLTYHAFLYIIYIMLIFNKRLKENS